LKKLQEQVEHTLVNASALIDVPIVLLPHLLSLSLSIHFYQALESVTHVITLNACIFQHMSVENKDLLLHWHNEPLYINFSLKKKFCYRKSMPNY
jgi:hypothetical protein